MQVIGAGFGRTGSYSLKHALEELGFNPCLHMLELIESGDRVESWHDAALGKEVDWRALVDGWEATVDWPGCVFYKELMATFPDAKVLLTVRDPDRWYDSAARTIHIAAHGKNRQAASEDDVSGFISQRVMAMVHDLIWGPGGTFNGRFEDRDYAIGVFNRHIEEVKAYVPADRLLVHEVKDGWEPLAKFLGKDVPQTPFPRVNDTDAFREMVGLPALAT